jgi:hypothetical protein
VYPRLSRIQSLYFTFRKVPQGNGGIDESRRFETSVVHARGSSGALEKVNALERAIFVRSLWEISRDTGYLQIIVRHHDKEVEL